MIAKDGDMRLYSGEDETYINGDITVDGNVINTNLQDQLDLKAPLHNPTFPRRVLGFPKGMVNLANVDNTSDLAKPISTAMQNALDLKANRSYVYTKNQVDTSLLLKADQATDYAKTKLTIVWH